MRKNIIAFLAIMLTLPLLEGCWNQEELTNLALVMAIGIDKAKQGKGYDITFEIVNPGNVASSFMGGGQGSPVAVYKSTGKTLLEASRNASKKISRRIYYAHTSAIVISEQVAREGIYDLLDILDRDTVFRSTTEIFIARKDSAENIVSTITILDKIPVNKMVKSLNVTEQMLGENTKITLNDLISNVIRQGKEPFANGVTLAGDKKQGKKLSNIESDMPGVIIKTDGIAMFKDGKLIGWIDGSKSRGVMWVLDKVKGTDIHIDWQGKKHAIGFLIRRSNVKVSANMKNGKPVIQVGIKTEGDIEEVNTPLDVADLKIIKKMEKKLSKEIEQEVSQSIKYVQSKKTDILGFGEKIHIAYPKSWKNLENNWNNTFATMEVTVKVDAFIRRNGIRNKPFWSDINK
jgi:spore germination protein KC